MLFSFLNIAAEVLGVGLNAGVGGYFGEINKQGPSVFAGRHPYFIRSMNLSRMASQRPA